jgi:hypothetical protein
MASDPRAAEKLTILKALDQHMTDIFNRWNYKQPERRNAFSAERLLPLSKPLGGGSPNFGGGAIGPGDFPGIKYLMTWYEQDGEQDPESHPKFEQRKWSDSIKRVEKHLVDHLEENRELHNKGDAPWFIATSPGRTPLLSGLPLHHSGRHKNEEGLVPHKTDWSQSLFLALRFKEQSLFTWVNKKHPEWLDENSEMAPLSDLGKDLELSPQEQMERDYILNELANLREFERQGPLYLQDHSKGEAFFARKGFDDQSYQSTLKGSHETWIQRNQGEKVNKRRNTSLTSDLSLKHLDTPDGEREHLNIASKAQLLMMMAREKGQQVEEGLYFDAEDGDMRQALMFQSSWMTRDKLMVLESWLAQYLTHGMEPDKNDYRDLLIEQGVDAAEAKGKAQRAFDERVVPALSNTFSMIETLMEARKEPILDFANEYLSGKEVHSGVPERDGRGIEIIGTSIDDSRLHPELLREVKEVTAMDRVWMTNRGCDYAVLSKCDDYIRTGGYLGENIIKMDKPTTAMLPMSHSVDQVIDRYEDQYYEQQKIIKSQEEKLTDVRKLSITRRDELREQYESRLRVVELLHKEQAKYLNLIAGIVGYALPMIKEPNPRYEGLKKIGSSTEGVEPHIIERPDKEFKAMLELYYPKCESLTIQEAADIVGALYNTDASEETIVHGAQNMWRPHDEIMNKRRAKGMPTYGWEKDSIQKVEEQTRKELARKGQSSEPSGTRGSPRFI